MGKIIVITGATSGIGKTTRELFEQRGDTVCSLARHDDGKSKNFYACDVSNEENVKTVFEEIGKKFGKIDILINNAGFGISGALELINSEQIKNLYDVNLFGTIYCYKYGLKYMSSGGKIVNISSACALFPLPYRGYYCSSKSAVSMLSNCMRMECKPLGIDVVAVCPGDVKTNFTKNRVKNFETNERYGDRIKNATQGIDGREDKRMKPDCVAKAIVKICDKKKTKPYYIVGAKYKVLNFVMRFFPLATLLNSTEKLFGGHKKPKNSGKEQNYGR
jgi:short-subunit dehydrogenase